MMVNIAIIDDGINNKCFYINEITEHIIVDNNCVIRNAVNTANKYSHGSICAAILSKHVDDVKITSICLSYDESVRGYSIQTLLTALELCLTLDIKILHLSLGVTDYSYYYDLLKIINRIYNKGVLIIAAYNKTEKLTMPACFSNVLGVMYSPYIKKGMLFRFLDNSMCGTDVVVNVKENITLKDNTFSCFEQESSYAVPLICSEVVKMIPEVRSLQNIKSQYGIMYEKNLDWMENPLIIIFSDEKIEIFRDLVVFDNYYIIHLPCKKFEPCITKIQKHLNGKSDIIMIGCKPQNMDIFKNKICKFLCDKNIAICIDDDSFADLILSTTQRRRYSLKQLGKKTLIQNRPSCDISISWRIYQEENEINDILDNDSNILFVSCEIIHILYGIDYIPISIQNSTASLNDYVLKLAYIHSSNAVCILKKEIYNCGSQHLKGVVYNGKIKEKK